MIFSPFDFLYADDPYSDLGSQRLKWRKSRQKKKKKTWISASILLEGYQTGIPVSDRDENKKQRICQLCQVTYIMTSLLR